MTNDRFYELLNKLRALAIEEEKKLLQLKQKEEMWSERASVLMRQLDTIVARLLDTCDFTPVQPTQFDWVKERLNEDWEKVMLIKEAERIIRQEEN